MRCSEQHDAQVHPEVEHLQYTRVRVCERGMRALFIGHSYRTSMRGFASLGGSVVLRHLAACFGAESTKFRSVQKRSNISLLT